ncbi:uncharacterized protein LOC134208389 [Armigeres subalbatus]|uniref:uncharacterized protein LOC134208389 n=1 Tax=Armigeres subalbatus TaxID=124917 RepID=UPI002ED298B7
MILPDKRAFPLKTRDDVGDMTRNFDDSENNENLKREIAYALSSAHKEDWLRAILTDEVTSGFHLAEEIRQINFIRHIISNITNTADKAFTAMVAQAKNRVYAQRRRNEKKISKSNPKDNSTGRSKTDCDHQSTSKCTTLRSTMSGIQRDHKNTGISNLEHQGSSKQTSKNVSNQDQQGSSSNSTGNSLKDSQSKMSSNSPPVSVFKIKLKDGSSGDTKSVSNVLYKHTSSEETSDDFDDFEEKENVPASKHVYPPLSGKRARSEETDEEIESPEYSPLKRKN